ncbi:MAG: restriction endonuclease [Candidatus Brocadia sp. WS118]|nr:MAG: restriction endonuclease [Candidatus Brocadia sp. WS118]
MAQIVVEKKVKKYTYKDYCKISDDKSYELIDGELLMTPSPITNHQRISRKLEFILEKFITENKLGELFDAPYDVYFDNENVVQPDLLFIPKDRLHIIGKKNVQGAPDLVIEIISENSAYRDMVQKKKLYAKFGVKEYWIVIPEGEEIEIYTLKDTAYQLYKAYGKGTVLESPLLKGLTLTLMDIF